VRNPRLLKALKAYLLSQGVTFITGTEVQGFATDGERLLGVMTDLGEMPAEQVVVAGGAWSQALLATVDQQLPVIEPVRGQMLLFRASPDLLHRIILNERRYLIPRRDGHILAGSTLEHVGFQKEITEDAREQLLSAAIELVPELAECTVERQWAGLRPGAPQGIPYIYQHPVISDLYVNCGHYRNGVVLGPAAAHLLVDLMLDRPPIVPLEPYGLSHRLENRVID
jgi:glycine oxidase